MPGFLMRFMFMLLLSACASGGQPAGAEMMPDEPRMPIFQDGEVHPAATGVWRNADYGWILQIDGKGIRRWQDTPAGCYATAQDGPTLMSQVEYRYFTRRGEERAQFEYLPSDGHTVFDRLPALPAACGARDLSRSQEVFEVFASVFERHYPFFERRGVNWAGNVARARDRLRPGMPDDELWQVLADLVTPLGDSHTKLIGAVDGERRRVQTGLGHTLPRIRSAGGEPAWLQALVAQTREQLEGGGHHVGNERIVWGSLGGRVGYLQIFTMGGFVDDQAPGSPEWAAAELQAVHQVLDEALGRLAGHEALILDLSNNRGGYDAVTRAIVSHFIEVPREVYTVRNAWEATPAVTYRVEPWPGKRFTGPVYVLTSDVTVSGGEITTMMLRQLPQVVHVGGTTRGAFSTPLAKPLPNGWYLELANEIFADMRGEVFEGRGIAPSWPMVVFDPEDPVASHGRALAAIVSRATRDRATR